MATLTHPHPLTYPPNHDDHSSSSLSSSLSYENQGATSLSHHHQQSDDWIPLAKDERSISNEGKWMSSKMRMMKKMINSGRRTENETKIVQSYVKKCDDGSMIRVCDDCSTTKTPLWRSGPRGPKSVCNACGIRRRKARTAAAIATTTPSTTQLPSCNNNNIIASQSQTKKSMGSGKMKKKKRVRLDFDDSEGEVSEEANLHRQQRVLPQDEKDAAILLMALSCGLVLHA